MVKTVPAVETYASTAWVSASIPVLAVSYTKFDTEERVLRPQNFPNPAPGRGANIYTLADGRKIAVLNIQGTTFMESLPCPFQTAFDFVSSLDDEIIFR